MTVEDRLHQNRGINKKNRLSKEIPNIMIKASPRTNVQQVLENHQTRLEQEDRGSRRGISKKRTKPMKYLMGLNIWRDV